MPTLLRVVAGLVLGTVVFAGLFFYLVVTNVTHRLEDPAVYNAALSETDAYARIYDEVLAEESFGQETGDPLGDIEIVDQDDMVDVLRQVFPPNYLQEQTEANVERFTAFLRYDRNDLALYVEMQAPLERIEPAVLSKVHQYIDGLEIEDPQSSDCSLSALQRLADASAERYTQLSEGTLPQSAPSLETLPRECRAREFDSWFDLVLDQSSMDSQTALALQNEREELRRSFVGGDTREFLKVAAGPIVKPQIDDVIADIRQDLQPNDRLDLVEWVTDEPEGSERAEFDDQAEAAREGLSEINGRGRLLALAMVAVAGLLLAAVHLPRREAMLRWPGVALLAGGSLSLVVGLLLNSGLPGLFRELVVTEATSSGDASVAAIELLGDVLEVFTREVTAGFMPATVAVMVVGAALIAASLFYDRIESLLRSTHRPPGTSR